MPKLGFSISSEELTAREVVQAASAARAHGFTAVMVSDHYHPWNEEQGESPFVWAALGGIAAVEPGLRLGTGVTCPTMRIHPAVIAQAAATTASMTDGGFFLGIGSGENLNEHIFADTWPSTEVRLEMLEESVEVLRLLWQGGTQSHYGKHYTVDNARIYSLPDEAPPIYMSAFGPKAGSMAARIADGLVTTHPAKEIIDQYRSEGGKGPVVAGAKACWAADEGEARKTAFRLWPNMGLPGELAQELRTPAHFEQACELVREEDALSDLPLGPDPEAHAESIRAHFEAGVDEVFIQQIGKDQEGFLAFYRDEVVPRLDL